MRVVVTDYIEADLDWERGELARLGVELQAHQLKTASTDELIAATCDADVVVVNMAPVTRALVSRWKRCRLVIRHGIGYDNVDVGALSARGIPLVNVPDYCVEEVAEQAIALFFALARQVVRSRVVLERSSRAGQWQFDDFESLRRIQGRTVGLIGFGRIGSRVYEKLAGFGFRWLICDPYLSAARQKALGIPLVPLRDLLRQADVVTLHTPLNDETRHLIDARALALMKPDACLVNTARGGLIDQAALTEALLQGRLGGAALDVFEHEPPAADDPLFGLPNVVLTPHLAWCSREAGWDIRRKIVEAIVEHRAGRLPVHCLNPEAVAPWALSIDMPLQ